MLAVGSGNCVVIVATGTGGETATAVTEALLQASSGEQSVGRSTTYKSGIGHIWSMTTFSSEEKSREKEREATVHAQISVSRNRYNSGIGHCWSMTAFFTWARERERRRGRLLYTPKYVLSALFR